MGNVKRTNIVYSSICSEISIVLVWGFVLCLKRSLVYTDHSEIHKSFRCFVLGFHFMSVKGLADFSEIL